MSAAKDAGDGAAGGPKPKPKAPRGRKVAKAAEAAEAAEAAKAAEAPERPEGAAEAVEALEAVDGSGTPADGPDAPQDGSGAPRAAGTHDAPESSDAPGTPEAADSPSAGAPSSDDSSSDATSDEATAPSVISAWEERAARSLAFLRRRVTGEYEVDEFGFDPDLNDTVLMGILRPLYDKYFRVEVSGIGNVPSEGGALLVGNHSGTVPVDALMVQVALLDDHPARRHLRMLAADLVFTLPFVGEMSRKMGHTLACNPDAERLLRAGEVVGVWPEGFKGVGKPFSQRYRLQRFGRGGFVSAALRTGVPIVPVSIVGAEEIYPKIADIKPLARLLGLPYFPVTPTFPLLGPLGLIPLPTKWHIAFGEPIATDKYDAGAAEDPMLVFDLTDQIRETIQDTLYQLLLQRRSVFF